MISSRTKIFHSRIGHEKQGSLIPTRNFLFFNMEPLLGQFFDPASDLNLKLKIHSE